MSKHESKKRLEKGHHREPNKSEGGKCFTSHNNKVQKNSCSYRWQAWLQAKDDEAFYNAYTDEDLNKVSKPLAKKNATPPKRPDWHVPDDAPKKADKPYGHNAHHVIPNGVLLKSLNKAAATTEKPARARMLIKGGLQLAEYNLNFKRNMIILPTWNPVAWVLKLPVHTEKDARHHNAYSRAVEKEVDKVMGEYIDAIKSELANHEATPKKLAKAKLDEKSDHFREGIKAWGKARSKLYLDKIPPSHWAKPAH